MSFERDICGVHFVRNAGDVRGAIATHRVDSNERQALHVLHDRHSSLQAGTEHS